ncbi:uncharacterized protein K444DRAFT_659975 [Hyaloscypha bicolor E]|uniref:Cora-domain-containing protein n=1 Tax=Hyaloscypha bicolor E TaxID=1095630 RepID=A0A2J6TNZ7_9HELO|nr:uncharacterized protein K444DRAFT_659975 [Hyaloscypha bicolor E]PMD64753.1 hypothetical protein K444DRAFT_659975 [Hyaloscypha bicolor E]
MDSEPKPDLENPHEEEKRPKDLDLEPEPEPDAEQRKIFITNLDRWGILALIGTASESQALGLRDTLYKHLAWENFIGVTFPPGLPMFQLAFHIPFYVWRVSERAWEDHRLDSNANRLRQCRDVSFLDWKSSGPSNFLYEAQMSCLVAGEDESRWVAYGFFDTYFDAVGEAKETVEAYHDDAIMEGGMNADPLTFGVIGAEKTVRTPREYFLSCFRIRIAQVKREWVQVVAKIRQSIRDYEQTYQYSLCMSRERSSSTAAEHNEMVKSSRDWIVQVKRLTTQLFQCLSKTVGACENFCLNHAIYFENLSSPLSGERSLRDIEITFTELDSLRNKLEYLAESCSEFAQELELRLILEGNEVGNMQHKIAQDNKGLALIMMIYISPIALAAAIFSMNRDVISFIPANFGSFISLVFGFGILGILILVMRQYEDWCWQVFMALNGQRCWQGIRFRRKTRENMEQS